MKSTEGICARQERRARQSKKRKEPLRNEELSAPTRCRAASVASCVASRKAYASETHACPNFVLGSSRKHYVGRGGTGVGERQHSLMRSVLNSAQHAPSWRTQTTSRRGQLQATKQQRSRNTGRAANACGEACRGCGRANKAAKLCWWRLLQAALAASHPLPCHRWCSMRLWGVGCCWP